MSHYTSHALVGPMWEHYSQHGVLAEEFCAFRYNEGLSEEDLGDLVLVYGRELTKWQTRQRKGTVAGRNVLTTQLSHFQFYPEAEFQRMQAKTEAFLRDRKQRESIYALVSSNLILAVNRAMLATNQFRFTVALKNKGTSEVSLKLTRDGMLRHREGGSSGSDFLGKEGGEIRLAPGEERVLPGWSEVSVKFIIKNGQAVECSVSRRSESGFASQGEDFVNTGRSGVRLGAGANLSEALHEMTLQALLWVRVDMGEVKALETVLKSPVLHYMTDLP